MARNTRKDEGFANEDEILLGVLTAIERDANTSQRTLSSELGVALGLANAYLKRCVRKGLIKIHQVPRRRYAYFLTPHGFTEKARLTGQYLSASFTFFRRSREQMSALMEMCAANGWKRIAIAGISDLAEVAILCAQDHSISLVGVIEPAHALPSFRGIPAFKTLNEAGEIDAIIVTDLKRPEQVLHDLETAFDPGRVLVPSLLRISRSFTPQPEAAGEAAE